MADRVPNRVGEDPSQVTRDPNQETEAPDQVAAGQQGIPDSREILDLGAVETKTQNMVSSRMTIRYTGYVGTGSTLGAKEIMKAAEARPLESILPTSLILVHVQGEPNALLGIPIMESDPAFLALEWIDEGRRFRANMMKVLQSKKIRIPKGTKMVIDIAYKDDPTYRHCVKLSWGTQCFVPINEQAEDDE